MTAIVGVLNKQAVAIAADSAVTITGKNGKKILNKANKIFTLSKVHPVGIMIYNSASFMMTPWEIIIKVYRKKLGVKNFDTVEEYKNDFFEYLRSNNFYSDDKVQLDFLLFFMSNVLNQITNSFPYNSQTFEQELDNNLDNLISFWKIQDVCSEFVNFTLKDFTSYAPDQLKQVVDLLDKKYSVKLTQNSIDKLTLCLYHILIAKENISAFSGLVFVGYGEKEIFPQLVSTNISLVVDNRLRWYDDGGASISNYSSAAVCPFAQKDVIETILTGIAPSLDQTYIKSFRSTLEKYNKTILAQIGPNNPVLYKKIQQLNLDVVIDEITSQNDKIKRDIYINPLVNAVGSLSKEDLAEMAESLIYLTYLKRRITFAEESVGGPVDVAVISKGDGFIWIKRKHYFNKELNQHYFTNYFKP